MSNEILSNPDNYLTGSTPNPDFTRGYEKKILKEIYYNCTECHSLIEILCINEQDNTIEFRCLNDKKIKHHKTIPIKEFLDKTQENTKYDNINKDVCEIHNNNKYMSFCFDCNKHLCKECLKTRDHIYHTKNNIIEIQPINTELNAMKQIIKYYDEKLDYLKSRKIFIKKKFNDDLDKYKTKLDNFLKNEMSKNEISKKNDLENNHSKFLSEIESIKTKYENEVKSLKHSYIQNKSKINNKYQLKYEELEVFYKDKLERIENRCKEILDKISFEKKIEELTNMKRINKLIYNTYNLYNNNYYNSKNINNIIMNFHKNNENIKNDIQLITPQNDYEIMVKLSYEKQKHNKPTDNGENNNDNDNNQDILVELENALIESDKQKLLLEHKLKEIKNEFDKMKNNYEKEITNLKNKNETNETLINNSQTSTIKTKEYDNGRYVGSILNDKREGKGSFFFVNGKKYEGEWKNDKEEGYGIMRYKNGDKYEGYFKNGKKDGKGIYYYNNNNYYEGDWKEDKKDGKGVFYGSNGDRKMGNYAKGKPIGKHVILTVNGDIENKQY